MYELELLKQTSMHNWLFVIRKPSGRREQMVWNTKDSPEVVLERAKRIVDRWNCDYGVRPKAMPAESHWHAVASANDRKTNLQRIKKWNTERIRQHKASMRRGKNV